MMGIAFRLVFLTTMSAILYRLGGCGNDVHVKFPWLPEWLFNTKARDVGCSLCAYVGYAIVLGVEVSIGVHIISFILLFASLTTYWDFLFGYDNHYAHGFMCAFAYLFYALATGMWIGFVLRCVAMTLWMGIVSAKSTDDVVEETNRGASIVATLPLMLI